MSRWKLIEILHIDWHHIAFNVHRYSRCASVDLHFFQLNNVAELSNVLKMLLTYVAVLLKSINFMWKAEEIARMENDKFESSVSRVDGFSGFYGR